MELSKNKRQKSQNLELSNENKNEISQNKTIAKTR